jgi:hypothetical protein
MSMELRQSAVHSGAEEPAHFDIDKYIGLMHDVDLSEAQKKEVLTALWLVMTSFVDLSFASPAAVTPHDRSPPSPNGSRSRRHPLIATED